MSRCLQFNERHKEKIPMKEGLIKDSYELIIKEIQTAVTVAYILAVGIGMLFNHQRKLIGKTKDVFSYWMRKTFMRSPLIPQLRR
jgi:hypothetical protein